MKRWIGLSSAMGLALALMAIGVIGLMQNSGPQVVAAPNAVQLAVAHLAPFDKDPNTAVTVTVKGLGPVLTDIEYGETSQGYETLPFGGSYEVGLVPAGESSPVLTKTLTVVDGKAYTAVAVGGANGQDLDILLLEDDISPPSSGYAKVRVGHLAPFTSAITDTLADVRTQDDSMTILDDVKFGEVMTSYLSLPADTYDLKITSADGEAILIDLYPVPLNDGDILSVFATGDGGNQPLGAFAMYNSPDDTFLPLAASLQLAHLAPFPMSATAGVTVTLDATPILTDFVFADSTEYLPVVAGVDHDVKVYAPGFSGPVMTATVNLNQAQGYAAVATGNLSKQPLELILLENEAAMAGTAKVRIGHLAPFDSVLSNTKADVRLQDGTLVAGLDDVPFGTVSGFLPLAAGIYDLKITNAANTATLIDLFPFTLKNGDILSVFAVGDIDATTPPLGAFKLPPGEKGELMPLTAQYLFMPLVFKNAAP